MNFIKENVQQKYGGRKELQVFLNDVATNDFKSVWNNVNGICIIFIIRHM